MTKKPKKQDSVKKKERKKNIILEMAKLEGEQE